MPSEPESAAKDSSEQRSVSSQIFKQEHEVLERYRAVIDGSAPSHEELLREYEQLGKRYEALLRQAGKLMRIGDAAQRRLVNIQTELEKQNSLLEEQQTAIAQANAELQEKNDRLNATLTEIGLLNGILDDERGKAQNLLLNILPQPIAFRLQGGEEVIADKFDDVTVLFADIAGFTELSSRISATTIVKILNELFSRFDGLLDSHSVEKIKTIGDCYMVAAGIPIPTQHHAMLAVEMALAMMNEIEQYAAKTGFKISMRVGLHCGQVVAGVIGAKKFIYDLWGDTVNTASRMESHGVAGKIHCSEAVFLKLKGEYEFEPRGEIDIKGKGAMKTYFLHGRRA